MQVIYKVGVLGQRLPIPPSCPPPLRDLITECWSDSPAARPSFAEILRRLEAEALRYRRASADSGAEGGLG